MSAYCPNCETDLDERYGICPACRWDPAAVGLAPAPTAESRLSLTERYRGTAHEALPAVSFAGERPLPRGRLFVLVGLVATAALYAAVMAHMGLLP
jgi:hypothetical protein